MEEWVSLYKSKSGERGIFNREAAKKTIAKLGDRRDPNHDWGTNPCCLHADTLIDTQVGQVPISHIVADPDGFMILSYNHETNNIEYTEIISGDMTRPNAEIIELEIIGENDIKSTIRLTPDHQVWTENRGYVDAVNITEDDIIVISENYKYGAGIYPEEPLYVNGQYSSDNKEMET